MIVKDLSEIVLHKPMLREMEFTLATERLYGEQLIKFITRSQTATLFLRRNLRKLQEEGRIAFWIAGEHMTRNDPATQYLFDRFPFMEEDEDVGKGRAEMTLVCVDLI